MSGAATASADGSLPIEEKRPGARHWRGKTKTFPLAPDQAARQGEITRQAFLLLGKVDAIAFLNTENVRLGGRPIALATHSSDGREIVWAELHRLHARRADRTSE